MNEPEIIATTKERICGMVSKIDAGEDVRVKNDNGETCTIERRIWTGSQIKLSNCIVGVPRRLLDFQP